MLKIKDGVDLKELEKFGFTQQYPEYSNSNHALFWEYKQKDMLYGKPEYIRVYSDDVELEFLRRVIYLEHCEDKLFDLIQAGLVEKVKEM